MSEEPSEAFRAGVKKNMDDMMVEQQRLYRSNQKMSADIAALRAELEQAKADLLTILNEKDRQLAEQWRYKSLQVVKAEAENAALRAVVESVQDLWDCDWPCINSQDPNYSEWQSRVDAVSGTLDRLEAAQVKASEPKEKP